MKNHTRWVIALLTIATATVLFVPDRANAQLFGKCGGIIGIPCPAGQWCDPEPNRCGGADILGTCVQVSGACPRIFRPVCGCNGRTYSNDCVRQNARVAKRHDGACRGRYRATSL